jgi:hypothetical protein
MPTGTLAPSIRTICEETDGFRRRPCSAVVRCSMSVGTLGTPRDTFGADLQGNTATLQGDNMNETHFIVWGLE